MTEANTIPSRWHSIRVEDLPQQRQARHLQQSLPDSIGQGHSRIVQLDQELVFIDTAYRPTRDLAVLSRIENQAPRLVVTLGLQGQSQFVSQHGETVPFLAGYSTITTFASSLGERRYAADTDVRQLRFSVSQAWLEHYLGDNPLSGLFDKAGVHIASQRPISAQAALAAQQLLQVDVSNGLGKLELHSNVLAVLAAELAPLCQGQADAMPYSPKELAMANAARDILLQEFQKPPTSKELARRVGTNQLKIKQLFHHCFNTTPYQMVLEARMQRAYHMLQNGACQVSAVAAYVGYKHPANFSAAFVSYFGFAPSGIRRIGHGENIGNLKQTPGKALRASAYK